MPSSQKLRLSSQKEVFLEGEGDSYFNRNKKVLNAKTGPGMKFYGKFLKRSFRILEIGCSMGNNLRYFHRLKGCECYGIDPSRQAVDEGAARDPFLRLSVGTSDKLNFPDEYFDFVLFGFCLYLVDRSMILRSVAEADRVLKNGGYLGITDFDVKIPRKRPYKHYEGIHSFKYEYWKLFDVYPHYTLVEKQAFSHTAPHFVKEPQERLSSVVLFKENTSAYITN